MKRENKPMTELEKAIEAVVLGKATKEQADLYKRTYPAFQNCGEVISVFVPQRNKMVEMVVLYQDSPNFVVAAVRTCNVLLAFEVAFNAQESMWVAYYRITRPRL